MEASAIKLALSCIVSIALSGPLRERGDSSADFEICGYFNPSDTPYEEDGGASAGSL